jgi:hypothetical protein
MSFSIHINTGKGKKVCRQTGISIFGFSQGTPAIFEPFRTGALAWESTAGMPVRPHTSGRGYSSYHSLFAAGVDSGDPWDVHYITTRLRLENTPETGSVLSLIIPVNRENGYLCPPQDKIQKFLS